MPDWESLHHLAVLARVGTLAATARALDVEHATVVRRIAKLEADLEVKLLDRRGRKIELTTQGLAFVSALRRMEEEAEVIARIAAGKKAALSGDVTISVPPALGAAVLGRPLARLREQHPGLVLHVLADTRISALKRREADLAIRLSHSAENSLKSTKLAEVCFRLYATAEYRAATPEDEWVFVGYDSSMDDSPQQLAMSRIANGRLIGVRCNTLEMQLNVVLNHGGVAMLPEFLAADRPIELVGPDVVRRDVWLVVHEDMAESAPVRAVARMIADELAEQLTISPSRAPD